MASSYIRELLAKELGIDPLYSNNLISTLKELFDLFIPGKHFDGIVPTADGKITFPVRTDFGAIHDINDLSSGEKELLYGYLRLHNLNPQHSIILIDEPELHLNPRLVQGLPQFYQKHLGLTLDNQIWLLTHSDAMLREALITDNTGVFHMRHPDVIIEDENQIQILDINKSVENAIIDLVGDLATYKPGSKVVILEGGGDDDFDVRFVSTLFPEFIKKVNLIHGSNKIQVHRLHNLLEETRRVGVLTSQVYSIVDKDSDDQNETSESFYLWDVYHIENYLLDMEIIYEVLCDISGGKEKTISEMEFKDTLVVCARESLPRLINHELKKFVSRNLRGLNDLSSDPDNQSPSDALYEAVIRYRDHLNEELVSRITPDSIKLKEKEIRSNFESDIKTGNWVTTFQGRVVLKRISERTCHMKYEQFRNLIVAKMQIKGYQPEGMRRIFESIISPKE